jgi:hypothetical protein
MAEMLIKKWEGSPDGEKTALDVLTSSPAQANVKENLIKLLQTGVSKVKFNKVDGTPAEMDCTLDTKIIPGIQSDIAYVDNVDVLRVYSVDRQGWRSFRIANVISIEKSVS